MIEEIKRQISLIFGHATIRELKDDKYQSESLTDQTTDDAVLVQHFGFKSKPPADSEAVIACINGNQDDTNIIAEKHEESEPEGLKEGETTLYNDHGVKLVLLEDGTLEVTADKITLNGDGKQFVTHAELDSSLQAFISALNSHSHATTATVGSSPVVGVISPVTSPLSIDISDSATTTVLTDG